jgi:hypothetical protein
MKKLFLMAALAAMVGVSCQQTPANEGDLASLSIRVAGNSTPTRAVIPAVDAADPQLDLTNGVNMVYVLRGDNVIHSEALTNLAETNAGQSLAGGDKKFTMDCTVYVLGNIPANITDVNFTTLTALKAATSVISYETGAATNTDYLHPAMGNRGGTPAVVTDPESDNIAKAVVNVAPLYSRITLAGLQGGEWISSFKVKAVYLDDYNSTFSMSAVGSDNHSNGTDTDLFDKFTDDGWFGDEVGTTWSNGNGAITAGSGKLWGYNVAAGTLVRVIIELEDVEVYAPSVADENVPDPALPTTTIADPAFVTVVGYTNASVVAFEAVKIYNVRVVSFDKGNISDEPNDSLVAINAQVNIDEWAPIDLDPIVGR